MYKYLLFVFIIHFLSCTDQGDPIFYSISNLSSYDLSIVQFDRFGKMDTILFNKNESKIMDQDEPPYDDGPFSDKDSIKLIFDDSKVFTYKSLISKDDCLNSDKNPFCQYSHYTCTNNNCTFEIDNIEYLKAR